MRRIRSQFLGPVLLAVVALAVVAPNALAGKGLVDLIGVPGSAGNAPGQFNNQVGVTVNDPDPGGTHDGDSTDPYGNSTDGYVYVADEDNHRIQVFDADGEFVFTFGGEVNATAPANMCPRPGFPGDNCAKVGNEVSADRGYLDDPQGIAIDQVDGSVYVSDQDNLRIQKFTAAGEFVYMLGGGVNQTSAAATICPRPGFPADVCKIGVSGTANGQFGSTFEGHPAVDPNTRDLWVPDAGGTSNRRMQKFDKDGTFLLKFGANGTGVGLFGAGTPNHVAVDDAGRIYVLDDGQDQVERFAADGTGGAVFAAAALSGSPEAGRIAIDHNGPGSADDRIYVVKPNGSASNSEIKELDESGTLIDTHMESSGISVNNAAGGLAVNPSDGRLYFSTDATDAVYVINDIAGPLQAAVDPVTEVTSTTATLNATINPNGSRTRFHFEISDDGVNYDSIPVPDQDAGLGTTAQQYSFAATGLKANTFYRVRLVATRTDGDQVTTGNLNFLTAVAPPTVTSDAASQVSDTGAQLNGRLHPGGLETTYWFEWGDDRYGNQTPVPAASAAGGVEKAVGVTLSELEPERYYHFRLCASNSATSAPVCGADRLFLTRGSVAAPPGRAYEMVTSPDKVLRRGGDHGAVADGPEYVRFNGGVPDLDGGALMINLYAGVNDPNSGAGWSGDRNYEVRTRDDRNEDGQTDGWYGTSLQDVPPVWPVNAAINDLRALSGDFSVSAWDWKGQLFENESLNSIHVLDDDGGPRGAGWYPWLDPAWFSAPITGETVMGARIAQHGERLVGWGAFGTQLRALRAVGDALAPMELSPPQTAGRALFLADPSSDWAPRDLVNECSGTAGDDATLLPTRNDSGTPADLTDDILGGRECGTGSPTSVLGASLGGTGGVRLEGAGITSLSDDGERIFFLSPDPAGAGSVPTTCAAAVGIATSCPPQLFVSQYDDDGNATVRWLSRAEDALFDAPQQIGLLGNGVSFEGASRDGSAVYFRTNAPLTLDDPNGGAQLPGGHTTGTASPVSWDLYRYEFGGDNNVDPAFGDPGDRLTRISGGPSLDADPNTNCTAASADCGGASNGGGSAVRFLSDDGSRAYFVTAGPIGDTGDSWNDSPTGSAATNIPGGSASSNTSTRNLYLYDATESGADAYRFVARLPFAASGTLDQCSTFKPSGGDAPRSNLLDSPVLRPEQGSSCVHGTRGGDALVFETTARLTADDTDTAGDVYLYDYRENALVRLSPPPPGAAPYVCATDAGGVVVARCNGDLGFGLTSAGGGFGNGGGVGAVGMRNLNVAEAADGTLDAVYFESALPLLSTDRNADRMDVYEYRRSDGRLSLVSPGHPDHGSFYSGNSLDGEDVFFWTENRISSWEIDDGDGDVYDARRGGGLPDPPAIPPICGVLADVCQGDGFGSVSSDARTLSSSGGGNATAGGRATLAVSSLSRKATRRASRTGRLALSVRTSSTERVSLTVRARLGGKAARVGSASKPVRVAGTVKVSVRLSPAARKRLRAGNRLRLTVEVRQAGARSRTISILLPGVKP